MIGGWDPGRGIGASRVGGRGTRRKVFSPPPLLGTLLGGIRWGRIGVDGVGGWGGVGRVGGAAWAGGGAARRIARK
jgi:hypothetical protein